MALSIDPDRPRRKRDHDALSNVWRTTIDPIVRRLAADASGLPSMRFHKAREAAWVNGTNLVNAQSVHELIVVRAAIDQHATLEAELMLSSAARPGG